MPKHFLHAHVETSAVLSREMKLSQPAIIIRDHQRCFANIIERDFPMLQCCWMIWVENIKEFSSPLLLFFTCFIDSQTRDSFECSILNYHQNFDSDFFYNSFAWKISINDWRRASSSQWTSCSSDWLRLAESDFLIRISQITR